MPYANPEARREYIRRYYDERRAGRQPKFRYSEEVRRRMSESHRGKRLTADHVQRMKAAAMARRDALVLQFNAIPEGKRTKLCPKCEQEKPLAAFHRFVANNGSHKSIRGVQCYCKDCARGWENEKRATNPKMHWSRYMCGRIKHRSAKRGYRYDLTPEYLHSICPDVCPALGIELLYPVKVGSKKAANDRSPSVDKFNPALGYVIGNVFVISNRANVLKRDASVDELAKVVSWMRSIQRGVA